MPQSISAKPNRKSMIFILFFRRIFSFSSSPSVSISDLTAIVAAYFAIPTGSEEHEAKIVVDLVRHALFLVDNLQGIGFLNSSGKAIKISNLTNCAADITFFSFLPVSLRVSLISASLRQPYPLIFC